MGVLGCSGYVIDIHIFIDKAELDVGQAGKDCN